MRPPILVERRQATFTEALTDFAKDQRTVDCDDVGGGLRELASTTYAKTPSSPAKGSTETPSFLATLGTANFSPVS